MRVTDTPPPSLAARDVQRLLRERYGVDGTLSPLVSERDQNFRLAKIANLQEAARVTDFQVEALRHLERAGCPVPVPRVVPAVDGSLVTGFADGDELFRMRLVTWVSGKPLAGAPPADPALSRLLGESLARLDAGLEDFSHPGEHQELLRDRVSRCFDDFERQALPVFPSLRTQVIHNDLNPGNVLITGDRPARVAGVIDFGDMVRAPLIVDAAIAASYLRSDADDALAPAAALVAGVGSGGR